MSASPGSADQLHFHAVTTMPSADSGGGGGSRRRARSRGEKLGHDRPQADWGCAGHGGSPPLNCASWLAMLELADRRVGMDNAQANCEELPESRESLAPATQRTADVQILSLSFNALEHLEWLSPNRFQRLRVLDVSHNRLTTLNGLEGVCGTLEVLRCNDNHLTQLPPVNVWESTPFLSLREVWISRNRLKDIVSSLRSLAVLPALTCLVAYKNPWSRSLSPSQVRSLTEAHLASLALFDGHRVTGKDRERSRSYWFKNELGQGILSGMAPEKAKRRAMTRSEMHSSRDARPWRMGMKKKTMRMKRRQGEDDMALEPPGPKLPARSHSDTTSSTCAPEHAAPVNPALDESTARHDGDSAESFGIRDIFDQDRSGPTTPPRPAASSAIPAESPRARLARANPNRSSASIIGKGIGMEGIASNSSSAPDPHELQVKPIAQGVGGGISQAMSMLPDLSSRLKRAGGSRKMRQRSRRATHKHKMMSASEKATIHKKATAAANAAVRGRQGKKSGAKRHWSNPPPKKFGKINSKTKNSISENKTLSDAAVPPMIAHARALARAATAASNASASAAASVARQKPKDSGEDMANESKGLGKEDDNGMSALQAARALAAAATAAAHQMEQMAVSASSASEPRTPADETKPSQPEKAANEMKTFYKGGVLATVVRKDGSAQARWPNSRLAISIDKEGDGYRTFVQRPGTKYSMAVTLDPQGRGSINRLSGKTLFNINGCSGGQMLDKAGHVQKRWDATGNVTDSSGAPCAFGSNGRDYVDVKLEEKGRLRARVSIADGAFKLVLSFRCKGVSQSFLHGRNDMQGGT